jgi:hypothetical protein
MACIDITLQRAISDLYSPDFNLIGRIWWHLKPSTDGTRFWEWV